MTALTDNVLVKPIPNESKIQLLRKSLPETGEVVAVGKKCICAKVGHIVVLTKRNFQIKQEIEGVEHLFIEEKDLLIS
jgi:co-chaperonin GroES (HSP10)